MKLFKNKEKKSWKELYFEKEQERDRMMKNVIDVRVNLYSMFPNKIAAISTLFQTYNLE